ncbi:MAG: T9SS type A sorting domain-containing protein [Bacteroidia bacterium]|nr:T9SS type A sorting domain-containing protein [Bacteroidia bacterium]NNF31087.1 T9SS type A sorting domain-containing protein [Flavobacteriaceae bacterium]MBT8276949.1 T9SS type A sorting domain-containing protein [Bacteroidia bacterium]NNJ82455.1 T9SS type A sorting domain-containing protein [Flavobacteriaceae bacterium]NNK55320.1 T9SS type A sorting domain-containing protein [Flavobacteriaceae bacterium]
MKLIFTLLLSVISIGGIAQSTFMHPSPDRPIQNRNVVTPITATISYQGYDEAQAYFGEGEYEIFLDNVDGILDKPIIVLDGFDPGDGRDITGLYNSLSFGGNNLADIVRDEGFDIVVLNAPQYTTGGKDIDGGADYIQRNAMVLVELINLMNDQKVGDEELVVLGPSMGGLIARYALSYMEQNSLDPETRLYISFDSPHRGANIPISLQYLINYLAQELGDPDALAIVENVLNSAAAKEMLYDHLLAHLQAGSTYLQDPTKLLPEGAPDFRDAFQGELDALGFPQTVRNVAMVNGSSQGTTTGDPGMLVVDTTLDFGSGATADVALRFTPEAGLTNTSTSFDSFLFGIPIGSFDASARSFAFTDGVDASPGGTSNISAALEGGGTNPVIQDFIDALNQDEYSFIPVLSALAIDNENDWYVAPDIGGIHNSAFVNTYIPSENESHVEITAASAQFALDEIRGIILAAPEFDLSKRYQLAMNPVEETIELQLDLGMDYSSADLKVFNVTGQELLSLNVTSPSNRITISHNLGSGLYFLNIQDETGRYSLKLLVR